MMHDLPDGGAPRLSVLLPTFNRGDAILPTIAALRAQVFDSFEIIVIDDGSTDGTRERLKALGDPRLHVATRPNGGISAARNTGADIARGSYLVPLDDDDIPRSDWLREFNRVIVETGAAFVSCGHDVVDTDTGALLERQLPQDRGPVFGGHVANLLAGTFAVRRDVYFEIGGFAVGLQSSHQTEFGLRLLPICAERGWAVASIDEPLIAIRRRRAAGRIERNPEKLLAGTEFILRRHSDRLGRSPETLAAYHCIAGVAAFRLGAHQQARRHFRSARRVRPWHAITAARYWLSHAPPIARRVWTPVERSSREP